MAALWRNFTVPTGKTGEIIRRQGGGKAFFGGESRECGMEDVSLRLFKRN